MEGVSVCLEEMVCKGVRFFVRGDVLKKDGTLLKSFSKAKDRFSELLACGEV